MCSSSKFVFSQSQLELNEEADREYTKANDELNNVYQQILYDYKIDTVFTQKLVIAQRLWLKFRDAHIASIFPAYEKQREYGTVYPMCNLILLTSITKERTAQLKLWLDGIEQGDVCSGSIKVRKK